MSLKKIAYGTFNKANLQEEVVPVDTAKRHVIKINGIKASQESYRKESHIKSKELIEVPVDSIAIFTNEYIPEHFPAGSYIEYTMTVNGKDYRIEPVNSHRSGIKILKKSSLQKDSHYVANIGEEIKSAFLTVVLKSSGQFETPRVSGIKILYGKGVESL